MSGVRIDGGARAYINRIINNCSAKTTCCLLTYIRDTNSVVFSEFFDDGDLEWVLSSLNHSAVQYLFCSVQDSLNTGLAKKVLIQWIGESAAEFVKATAVQQLPIILNQLSPIHLTVTARCEEDIDENEIKRELSKSSSQYGVHKEKVKIEDISVPSPVGTNYKKADALRDIKGSNRDQFWAQEQKESERERQLKYTQQREANKVNATPSRIEWTPSANISSHSQNVLDRRKELEALQHARVDFQIHGSAQQMGYTPPRQLERQRPEREQQPKYNQNQEARKLNAVTPSKIESSPNVITSSHSQSVLERKKELEALRNARVDFQKNEPEQRMKRFNVPPQEREAQKVNFSPAKYGGQPSSITSSHSQSVLERKKELEALKHARVDFQRNDSAQIEINSGSRERANRDNDLQQIRERLQHQNIWDNNANVMQSDDVSRQSKVKEAQMLIRSQSSEAKNMWLDRERTASQSLASPVKVKPPSWKPLTFQQNTFHDTPGDSNEESVYSYSQPHVAPADIYSGYSYDNQVRDDNMANSYNQSSNDYGYATPEDNYSYGYGNYHDGNDYEQVEQYPSDMPLATSIQAKALYDYDAIDDSEITIRIDDVITSIEQIDPGWWRGVSATGQIGLFPANYVELI